MSSTTNPTLSVSTHDGGTLELPTAFGASRLLHVEVDRKRHDTLDDAEVQSTPDRSLVSGMLSGTSVAALWSARRIGGQNVWEFGLELRNEGDAPVTVTRMDPLAAHLEGPTWSTLAFHSAWGDEWRPVTGTTDCHQYLDSRSGRSSHGIPARASPP